jgi:membrane-associated phospholipid phosphatase
MKGKGDGLKKMRLPIRYIIVLMIISAALCTMSVMAGESAGGNEGTTRQDTGTHADAPPSLTPFSNLGTNLYDSFVGYNTFFHLGGIAATMIMVNTDADYTVYRQFKSWTRTRPYFFPSLITGTSCWLIIAAPLFCYGYFRPNTEALGGAYAIFQSTLISIVYATLLKALTGRPAPEEKWYLNMRKESREFRFGFLRGGIFYGWPGGHVMITTATVASLVWYYPDKWWISIPGALLVAYTMIGVTVHNGHWMSDNIAGLLMGYAIGSTVGRSFRKLVNRKLEIDERQVEIVPIMSLSTVGINAIFHY